jgi:hypothetical protein
MESQHIKIQSNGILNGGDAIIDNFLQSLQLLR